ncbi:MAG: hypothetical protein HY554_03310 [Elusimicrobia bacterium]|nr:hypothetical protein [Elusimicrobiota bacterium]
MKTMHAAQPQIGVIRLSKPGLRQHDRKRLSSWRVLGATVAGFPAFLWQLTSNHDS